MVQIAVGSVLGNRFRLERLAGRGGMGTVYRAQDRETGYPVAIKLLHHEAQESDEHLRFEREAQLLAELHHPAIVSYVAHGHTEGGQPYLAMEWLDGEDLAHYLSHGPLAPVQALSLLLRISDALTAAHNHGVIHRDLKPSNLFLPGGEIGQVKVLDFGIARRMLAAQPLTQTGIVVGTPEYMAPEQARGARLLTAAADVFSLGCILYECVAGRPAFAGAHLAAVMVRILFEEPASFAELGLAVPEALQGLVDSMLRKNPAARLGDARQVHERVYALLDRPELPSASTRSGAIHVAAGGAHEQGLLSVVLAGPPETAEGTEDTVISSQMQLADAQRASLSASLNQLGASCEWLATGSLVATLSQMESATDQAVQAARVAMRVKEHWPAAIVSLCTGPGRLCGLGVVGEVVERAARPLRQSAAQTPPGFAVFADELSARLLEGRFAQTPHPAGVLLLGEEKGSDASRPLLGKPTPCVGRETELAMLEAQVRGTGEEGEARAVLVLAPPGTGKSRLRHELLRRIAERSEPTTVLMMGRSDLTSSSTPYGLWASALRALCELGEEVGPAAYARLAQRLGRQLASFDAERIAPLLADLCGVASPAEVEQRLTTMRGDPRRLHDEVRAAFVDFLRAESQEQTVLVVLDDVHWADTLSVGLLDAILSDAPSSAICLLAFARPELRERFPRLWAGRRAQEIVLKPLSRKACERLIKHTLGAAVSADLLARIVEQSAGNALFLEELIRQVHEGGADSGSDTVLAMLQARIGRFDPDLRRLIRHAAVFGLQFRRSGVADLLGMAERREDGLELDRWLLTLTQAEIIEPQSRQMSLSDPEYRFRHALVRDAALRLLDPIEHQAAHRATAAYLARQPGADPAVLAGHYRAGREWEPALRHYRQAAEVANARLALVEAKQHLAEAWEMLTVLPDSHAYNVLRIEVRLAQVRAGLISDPASATLARIAQVESLCALLPLAMQDSPEGHLWRGWAQCLRARLFYYRNEPAAAKAIISEVLGFLSSAPESPMAVTMYLAMGSVLISIGNFGESLPWLERANSHQNALEAHMDRIRIKTARAAALMVYGKYQDGIRVFDELIQSTDRRQISAMSIIYNNYSLSLRFCGAISEFREKCNQTEDYSSRTQDVLLLGSVYMGKGWLKGIQGQYDEAMACVEQGQHILNGFSSRTLFDDWFAAATAEIALFSGRFDTAIRVAEGLIPTLRSEGRRLSLCIALQVWGLALGCKDPQSMSQSDAHIEEAARLMEGADMRIPLAILRLQWSLLCRKRGRLAEADQFYAAAIAQYRVSECMHLVPDMETACRRYLALAAL